jgi:lysophospholipase L1-like esterase
LALFLLDTILMKRSRTLSLCLLTGLIVCSNAPHAFGATPRLRRLVVVGDSLLAGFASGGFVKRGRVGQVNSAAVLVARRAQVRLPLPLIDRPGLPAPLVIVDRNRNGRLDTGEVRRSTSRVGFRSNRDTRARNLAVPGEDMESVFERLAPEDVAGDLVSGDVEGRELLKFAILGLPLQREGVSQISRARQLRPTFILVWIGSNDVLDMATRTNPAAVGRTPEDFGNRFRRLLEMLADTGAGMAVANLPNPTGIAGLRRAAGDVTTCRTAGGATQPVAADDLLSVDLDPNLLPTPPCGKVLNAAEQAAVGSAVGAFNGEIATAIAAVEQSRGTPIATVDTFSRFESLRANGFDLDGDGVADLDTRYLGGIFSLDGIHPTRTGNAIIANAFIDAINARFGEAIPPVDVARVAARDKLVGNRFRPAEVPPFGLINDEASDDIEDFFPDTFDDVKRGAERLGNRLERLLDDFTDLF